MNDLEQRIIRHLNDQVTSIQAPSDLAGRCLRRAEAVRRRRRATAVAGVAAAAAVVVAGVAVLAGLRPGGGPDRHTPPATHPAPTTTRLAPPFGVPDYPDPAPFQPWFRSLPQGELNETFVGLPHGPTFQYQGVTYRRPGPSGSVIPFGVTVQGLLAALLHGKPGVGRDFDTRVILLLPDGTFRTLATGRLGEATGRPGDGPHPGGVARVSADGTRVAYALIPAGSTTEVATVTAQDLRTGQRWTKTSGRYASVTGWSGNDVVVITPGPSSQLWAPDRGSTRTFGRRTSLTPAGPASDRLLSGAWDGYGRCRSVISSANFDTVYQGCDADEPMMISPDGRWVLLGAWKIRDLDTGSVLPFSIQPPGVGPLNELAPGDAWQAVRWDDERHMLFAFQDPLLPRGELGLVRCDVEGRCERASQP